MQVRARDASRLESPFFVLVLVWHRAVMSRWVPLPVPEGKPVCTRTHVLWVRVAPKIPMGYPCRTLILIVPKTR